METKKVTLDDHYVYNGVQYAPGEVEVSGEIAAGLKAGMKRKKNAEEAARIADEERIESTKPTAKTKDIVAGVGFTGGGGGGLDEDTVQQMIRQALDQNNAEWEAKLSGSAATAETTTESTTNAGANATSDTEKGADKTGK